MRRMTSVCRFVGFELVALRFQLPPEEEENQKKQFQKSLDLSEVGPLLVTELYPVHIPPFDPKIG